MKKALPLLFFIWIFSLQSCKKTNISEQNTDPKNDIEFVVKTEKITDDLLGLVDNTGFDDTQQKQKNTFDFLEFPSCLNRTVTMNSPNHYTITLEFNENGCQCPNGNIYKGTVIIDRMFSINERKFTGSITFDSFYINDIKIEGEASFERVFKNSYGFPESEYEYEFIFTFPNGDIAQSSGEKTTTWIQGFDTPAFSDNVFLIDGETDVLRRNGLEIEIKVLVPIRKIQTCKYYVSGILEIKENNQKMTLDFGNGACDNEAVLTYPDGTTDTIHL
jgi:hypothetical protein